MARLSVLSSRLASLARWLGALGVVAATASAQAQEVSAPRADLPGPTASADDEWLSGVDRSWDPAYSEQWYQLWGPGEGGHWSLSISAGLANGRVQRLGWGNAAVAQRTTSEREAYAFALLEVPMGGWQRPAFSRLQGTHALAALAPNNTGSSRSTESTDAPVERTPVPDEGLADAKSEAGERLGNSPQGQRGAENTSEEKSETSDSSPTSSPAAARQDRENAQLLELTGLLQRQIQRAPHSLAALSRLRSLTRRSRHSGMVPELRLRGVLGFDQTTSLEDAGAIVPGETTTRGARDSLVEARLTFRLDRLIYGASEASLDRRRAQMLERMRDELQEAAGLLLEWIAATRRAQDRMLLPDELAKARDEQRGALVQLHLLTNGWFEGKATLRQLGLTDLLSSLESGQESSP